MFLEVFINVHIGIEVNERVIGSTRSTLYTRYHFLIYYVLLVAHEVEVYINYAFKSNLMLISIYVCINIEIYFSLFRLMRF